MNKDAREKQTQDVSEVKFNLSVFGMQADVLYLSTKFSISNFLYLRENNLLNYTIYILHTHLHTHVV